jgi:hypothetical protein
MADFQPLIGLDDLKTTLLDDPDHRSTLQMQLSYDELADALTLQFVSNTIETVVLTVDDYVGLLYLPDSLDLVGVYIEDVKYGFLDEHPQLRDVWARWERSLTATRPVGKTLFLELAGVVLHAIQEDYRDIAPNLVDVFA